MLPAAKTQVNLSPRNEKMAVFYIRGKVRLSGKLDYG